MLHIDDVKFLDIVFLTIQGLEARKFRADRFGAHRDSISCAVSD